MSDDERTGTAPPLEDAQKLGEDAAAKGFDWNDAWGPLEKIREELCELEELMSGAGCAEHRLDEELGDLLFAVVNLARHLGVDASGALERGNDKFARRFERVEQLARQQGTSVESLTLQQLEELWQHAKKEEGSSR